MPIDLASLLPHSPPMLMLSELLGHQGDRIDCRCEIKRDNPLLVDGRFPPLGGLEMLAQASGVLLGLRRQGEKPAGAIVQVKSFMVGTNDIPLGCHVKVSSTYLGGSQDAAIFEGHASVDGERFFSGSLMLMVGNGWAA